MVTPEQIAAADQKTLAWAVQMEQADTWTDEEYDKLRVLKWEAWQLRQQRIREGEAHV